MKTWHLVEVSEYSISVPNKVWCMELYNNKNSRIQNIILLYQSLLTRRTQRDGLQLVNDTCAPTYNLTLKTRFFHTWFYQLPVAFTQKYSASSVHPQLQSLGTSDSTAIKSSTFDDLLVSNDRNGEWFKIPAVDTRNKPKVIRENQQQQTDPHRWLKLPLQNQGRDTSSPATSTPPRHQATYSTD